MPSPITDVNRSRLALDMGYNVAGWIEEIFIDAEILIPDFMWGHVDKYDEQRAQRYNDEYVAGRVISIAPISLDFEEREILDDGEFSAISMFKTTPHFVVHFVMITSDGLQIHKSLGRGYEIFFKIPVN